MSDKRRFHGVNLGNWLVLERWMKPALFEGTEADDVYGLERDVPAGVLGPRLREHYDSYVTRATFDELAAAGVDLVRIPVPYWTFGSAHHDPVVEWLDRAFAWAEATGIKVLVDLHTVPGSQNGFDNGGICALVTWHRDPARIDFAVDVVRRLAERYAGSPALFGVEPLNEPVNERWFQAMTVERYGKTLPERVAASEPCPMETLRAYYERAYEAVREACGPDVALVLHDRFELDAWDDFMPSGSAYENVWLDTHLYVGFSDGAFERRDLAHYLAFIRDDFGVQVAAAARHHPVLVGEWSNGNHIEGLADLTDDGRREVYRQLSAAQLAAWDRGNGGCFWSFATDAPGRDNWSLLASVRRGWLSFA